VSDTFSKLAVAGTVAILLFATIGQLSHDHHVSLGGYAADALPLLASWLVVARLTGRFLPTWLIGVTIGVAIRMVVLGHYHWNELAFLAVALVFIGAFALIELRAQSFVERRRSGRISA
jgi:Protein of unknown function (DUF3054)